MTFATIIPPKVSTSHGSRLWLKLWTMIPNVSRAVPTRKAARPAIILWSPSRSYLWFSLQTKLANNANTATSPKTIIMSNVVGIQNPNGLRNRTRRIISIPEIEISCSKLFFIFDLENILNSFLKKFSNFQGQDHRGRVIAFFDSNNGLARYSKCFG